MAGVVLLLCSLFLVESVLAEPRIVVMEHFTNGGCGPCATNEPWITEFVRNHRDDLVVVSYHVSWPWSGDPFYQANIVENTARKSFYGVTAVPHILMDGWVEPNYPYYVNYLESAFNTAMGQACTVKINPSGTYLPDSKSGTGTLSAQVIAEQAQSGTDLRVMMATVEDDIRYTMPNGISVNTWVFRDMFPTTNGIPVSFSPPYPDTVEVSADFTIDPSWGDHAIYFVVFLQDFGGTRRIKQGVKIFLHQLELTDVASDGELAGLSGMTLGQNFPNPCNPTTVFPLSVIREGPASLSIYDVEGRRVRDVFAGRLSAGSHKIDWDGRDDLGRRVASGIYYAYFTSMGEARARKLVVIR
jgi:hypothetical protein